MKKLITIAGIIFLVVIASLIILLSFNSKSSFTEKDKQGTVPVFIVEKSTDSSSMALKSDSGNIVYSGTTAIQIKQDGELILSLKGVDGVGGVNLCDRIYNFKDTEESYVNKQKQAFLDLSGKSEKDFEVNTIENFYEFNLYGLNGRIINNELVFSEKKTPFNQICGKYMKFPELQFIVLNKENNKQIGSGNLYEVNFNKNDVNIQELVKYINEL